MVFSGSHTHFLVKPSTFWDNWILSVSMRYFLIRYGTHRYVVVKIVHSVIHKYSIHKVSFPTVLVVVGKSSVYYRTRGRVQKKPLNP